MTTVTIELTDAQAEALATQLAPDYHTKPPAEIQWAAGPHDKVTNFGEVFDLHTYPHVSWKSVFGFDFEDTPGGVGGSRDLSAPTVVIKMPASTRDFGLAVIGNKALAGAACIIICDQDGMQLRRKGYTKGGMVRGGHRAIQLPVGRPYNIILSSESGSMHILTDD